MSIKRTILRYHFDPQTNVLSLANRNDAIRFLHIKVKMTETHELNRPVICLRYAARGVTHQVKSLRTASDYRFSRPAPLKLSTARHGCAQTVNCRLIRFIFLIGYDVTGSVVHNKIELKRTAQTINYFVGSVGNRPVGQLGRNS